MAVTVTGNIVNSGVIGSLSAATGTVGIGVGAQTTIDGHILNSGNLDTAIGIEVNGGVVEGGVVNTGDVNAAGDYYAIAVEGNGVVSGGLTNGGSIGGSDGGIGIVGATLSGGLLNTGDITGGAVGIQLTDASVTGDIDNAASGGIDPTDGSAIVVNAQNANTTIQGNIVNAGELIIPQGQDGIVAGRRWRGGRHGDR